MIVKCSVDKCPFRYEKVTVCSYYINGICDIMSDDEPNCIFGFDCDLENCDVCPNGVFREDYVPKEDS